MPGTSAGAIVGAVLSVILQTEAPALKVLTIGDDLTAEYALQTTFSAPASNPTIANVPNWVEFLATNRSADFDFGSYAPNWGDYEDARISGYACNWGISGFDSLRWAIAIGSSAGPWKTSIRDGIVAQFDEVEAAVIMIGMQDLIDNYAMIFEGTEPANYFDGIVARILAVRDVLGDVEGAPPFVVCTVPDAGALPAFRALYTDPTKRAAARAKIQGMNSDLKALAAQAGTPVADIHAVVTLRP